MTSRIRLTTIAFATLLALPTVASAAIVQKWQTGAAENYRVISLAGDANGDGLYDVITSEASGSDAKIGIRSAATGALIAQTALAYKINDFTLVDLDSDGVPEILIQDINTGHYICFNWVSGSSTLAVRWTSPVAFTGPAAKAFLDFDGNGKLYTVLMLGGDNHFYVYDRTGALVGQVTIPGAPAGATGQVTLLEAADFNQDSKQELLIDVYLSTGGGGSGLNRAYEDLWAYQLSSEVGVGSGAGPSAVSLGPSYPNPTFSLSRVEYSVPTTGPATLRLFDVSGRQVRTLVQGEVPAGKHAAVWDGRDGEGRVLPAGAYFYELNAGGKRQTQQVVRLR